MTIASTILPVGHAELFYVSPCNEPGNGANWPEETDWPGIRVELSLPANSPGVDKPLRLDLRAPGITVFGADLSAWWGEFTCSPTRSLTFRAKTLAEAEALAEAALAEAATTLGQVMSARQARLAQRRATIEHAHARHGKVTPPPQES